MMRILLLAAVCAINSCYYGVLARPGEAVPGGFELTRENGDCEGNNLTPKPLRLDLWACAYDCMIDTQCVTFVLAPGKDVHKCFLKSSCDTFTDKADNNAYTKVETRDPSEDPPAGYIEVDAELDCPAEDSFLLHGADEDRLGCAWACDMLPNCVGFVLDTDSSVHKRCNVQVTCADFQYHGAVYSGSDTDRYCSTSYKAPDAESRTAAVENTPNSATVLLETQFTAASYVTSVSAQFMRDTGTLHFQTYHAVGDVSACNFEVVSSWESPTLVSGWNTFSIPQSQWLTADTGDYFGWFDEANRAIGFDYEGENVACLRGNLPFTEVGSTFNAATLATGGRNRIYGVEICIEPQ